MVKKEKFLIVLLTFAIGLSIISGCNKPKNSDSSDSSSGLESDVTISQSDEQSFSQVADESTQSDSDSEGESGNSETETNTSQGKSQTTSKAPTKAPSKAFDRAKYVSSMKSKWHIEDNKSLTWYVNYAAWQYNNDWNSYPVLKDVSDITGVTPRVMIPTGDGQLRLQTMMATNSLPDLITLSPDDVMATRLISQGFVWSYDELSDKYSPGFKNKIDPEVWSMSTAENNKLYGIPCFFIKDISKLGATTFNVRKDIWESLGKPDMSTPQGYKNALIQFKNKYPKINGVDSIPMTLGNPYYRFIFEESFGVKTYYVKPDGKVQIRFKDPKYVNVVKYLNDLYRSGLMDPEVFTKQDGSLRQDLASGKVFSYPATYWDLDAVNASLNQQKAGTGFIAVEPVQAVSNVSFPGQNRRGWMTTMVSKNSRDPKTAMKFVEFMSSKDGNLLVNYGYEGEHYSINGNNISRTFDVATKMNNDPDKFSSDTGIFTFRLFFYSYFNEIDVLKDKVKKRNDEIAGKYVRDNSVFSYRIDPDPATPVGRIATQVWNLYNARWPLIIMSDSEQDALDMLDTMINEMEKQGLSRVEEYWTGQYKKNVSKFGVPK